MTCHDVLQEAADDDLVRKAQETELTLQLKLAGYDISLIGSMYPPVGVIRPPLRSEMLYGQISDFEVSLTSVLCLQYRHITCILMIRNLFDL